MSATVTSLAEYRARLNAVGVDRQGTWVRLVRGPRSWFLSGSQALAVAEVLQYARTLESGRWEAHGVEFETRGRTVTITTAATGSAVLSRREANSLTLELARAGRAATEAHHVR